MSNNNNDKCVFSLSAYTFLHYLIYSRKEAVEVPTTGSSEFWV